MFKENYIITGTIECLTGLHIGGSNDSVEIGGSDNVIIRDSLTNLPYIPGSSLKGKLRSLMELNDKVYVENLKKKIKGESDEDAEVDMDDAVKIFGGAADKITIGFPTRIIVRDSFPTDETIKLWERYDNVINGAELKYENQLDRVKSEANPRNIERVPRHSKFDFEIILSTYDKENMDNLIKIIESMALLEDNYLGGSGSRGFGQIKFGDMKIIKRDQGFYKGENMEDIIVPKSDGSMDIYDVRRELINFKEK